MNIPVSTTIKVHYV